MAWIFGPCALQILLLESEKARILLASNKIDQSMRDIRQQVNERRMHRIAHDRVFGEVSKDNGP